jgi:hypothetical protein
LFRHDGAHHATGLGIHAGRGLIQDQHLWPAHQGQTEGETLALPARQASVGRVRDGPQAERVQQAVGIGRPGVEASVLSQALGRPGPQVDAAGLEHQPDPRTPVAPGPGRLGPEDPDRAGIGRAIALDDLQGRGLARAVRSQHSQDLAAIDRQADVLDHDAPAVALREPVHHDRRRGGRGHGAIRA